MLSALGVGRNAACSRRLFTLVRVCIKGSKGRVRLPCPAMHTWCGALGVEASTLELFSCFQVCSTGKVCLYGQAAKQC